MILVIDPFCVKSGSLETHNLFELKDKLILVQKRMKKPERNIKTHFYIKMPKQFANSTKYFCLPERLYAYLICYIPLYF